MDVTSYAFACVRLEKMLVLRVTSFNHYIIAFIND